MKIIIERAALLKTLSHVQSVVERRNTIPILSNVMLIAEGGTLTLTATDLDIQVTETSPAVIEVPGRSTVSAHTIFDIVRKMPDGEQISIDVADGRMAVRGGRARFSLPVLPADDFPMIAVGDLPHSYRLPAEVVGDLLGKVRYAMSTEETRYYLNGIFLHTNDDSLIAVSTDGHRLAKLKINRGPDSPQLDGVIIPRKCVGEVLKVIDDVDGEVTVSISSSKIRFEMGNLVYVSKLVDGSFPDYNRVIPTANSRFVTVNAKQLALSIDRVSTISSDRTRAIKLEISKGKLTLSVNSPENGRAVEELEVDYDGTPMEIGFNSRYFADVLQQNSDGMVELSFDTPATPMLIKPVEETGGQSLLMPMRV